MNFDQLLNTAAEQANEDELINITWQQARAWIDELPEGKLCSDMLANALDYAQGDAHNQNKTKYILIKITA